MLITKIVEYKDAMRFGELIKLQRKNHRLSLKEVADYLQIHETSLSRVERGKRRLDKNQVKSLAKYFKLKEGWLLKMWRAEKVLASIQFENNIHGTYQALKYAVALFYLENKKHLMQ